MNESRNGNTGRGTRAAATCRIRPARWQDWKALAVLFRQIFPELTTEQVSRYIRDYEDAMGVAEIGGELAGFYQFIPRPGEATAWLNYIGVLPAHYRDGIGTRLLRDYEARAAKMGLVQAEFAVLRENDRAIRFYEKHGYIRLHSFGDKYRYRKTLTADVPAAARPGPALKRTRLERLGRRLLYLVLVSLPLLLGDL